MGTSMSDEQPCMTLCGILRLARTYRKFAEGGPAPLLPKNGRARQVYGRAPTALMRAPNSPHYTRVRLCVIVPTLNPEEGS